MPKKDPEFRQTYFIGDRDVQVIIRRNNNHIEQNQQKAIVTFIETFLNVKNHEEFRKTLLIIPCSLYTDKIIYNRFIINMRFTLIIIIIILIIFSKQLLDISNRKVDFYENTQLN